MKKGVSKQLLVAALLIVTGLGGAGAAHFTRPGAAPAPGAHKVARLPQMTNTNVLGAATEQSSSNPATPAPASSGANGTAVHPHIAVKAAAVAVPGTAAPVTQSATSGPTDPTAPLPASDCKPTDSCWQPTFSLPLPCLTDVSPAPGSGKTVHALDGAVAGASECSAPVDPVSPQPTTGTLYGGYPLKWATAAQDSIIDDWGMFNRESVSYAAYKVHTDYQAGRDMHDMPYWGGNGNANQWPANAMAAGIPVDTTPSVGSIAISLLGTYGQAMYVLQTGLLNGQPAIYVGQYNWNYTGQYSEQWRLSSGLQFIHF